MTFIRSATTIALSVLVGAFAPTFAQPTEAADASVPAPVPAPTRAMAPAGNVTVIGVGELQVAPDIVTLTVEAVNNDGSPADASAETRKAMNAILAAARRSVPISTDLRTARMSINPEYEWVEGKRKFRGYVASQTLEITLRDLSRVDSLLEHLNKTPLTTLGNLDFKHSKSDSLTREARALAVRNAALNAKSLCAAAGRSCDDLTGVRMAGAMGPAPMMEFKAMRVSADAGSAMPVQPGVLTFSAMVEADYRLK